MPNADRAAVAREVLTKAEAVLREDGHDTDADVIAELREEFYPAPPAPETVTVEGVQWERRSDGRWLKVGTDAWPPLTADALYFLDRIASDARVIAARDARIAELEKAVQDQPRTLYDSMWQAIDRMGGAVGALTGPGSNCHVTAQRVCETLETLQAERDAALRALEEAKNRPCPCAVASKTLEDEMSHGEEPECPAAAARLAATAPAPIPLGAVLEVEGDPDSSYERVSGGWIRECTPRVMRVQRLEKVYRDDDAAWGNVLTQYYHARHPVATRETVERVEEAIDEAASNTHSLREMARAALSAAGFTLEGA